MSELPPHLADVPLEVRAELACPPMKLRQVLELRPGSVLSTGKLTGYSVELIVAGLDRGSDAERRRKAVAIYALMVGTLQLARAVNDKRLSEEILQGGADEAVALTGQTGK